MGTTHSRALCRAGQGAWDRITALILPLPNPPLSPFLSQMATPNNHLVPPNLCLHLLPENQLGAVSQAFSSGQWSRNENKRTQRFTSSFDLEPHSL